MRIKRRSLLSLLALSPLWLTGCTLVELQKSSVRVVDPQGADPGLQIEFFSDHDLSKFGLQSITLEIWSADESGFRHWADLQALGTQRRSIIFGLFEKTDHLYAANIDLDLVTQELKQTSGSAVRCAMHQTAKPWPNAISNVFRVTEEDVRRAILETADPTSVRMAEQGRGSPRLLK